MKAAIYTQYGPPEVVNIQDVDKPIPTDNDVLIRVHATTVNRTDCGFRSANYFVSRFWSGLLKPKFHILGCEFAGEVEAVGKHVTTFKAGDRVFGYNDARFGGHAEYTVMAEQDAIATIPGSLTYEEAAPITEGGHYALCDIRAARAQPGHTVLVYGATGAIGSAAVQLLKHLGATVTAVCATSCVDLVKSLGADQVIDYTRQDYTHSGQTYDFVFDAVGKSSFGQARRVLKKTGVYISTELGKTGENVFLALTAPLSSGPKVLFPLPTITKDDVLFLKKLVDSGEFRPVIDRRYPLDQVVEAYRYVETGQKIGNVVLSIR
ncbi:NAD(P)-dependent alcohol dehydrogenase [Fibrisoma montanum]|uniref:NAD(P)-dependent alcohol dehydrogenase n=1 Tax=Fibrisoma montanum TaxID=2305895 RepID=A0A418MAE9_9BACT|nr:NAD(P)-dependent alcohol dehydrogenase [Fibrisoma montanum]RIV23330.1 NAD(P)-dependent alcohol dehydrogenase [Fibrisoma montanum]